MGNKSKNNKIDFLLSSYIKYISNIKKNKATKSIAEFLIPILLNEIKVHINDIMADMPIIL
ncbi:hypothetical protein OPLHCY645_06320 [Clostridium tetani]